MQNRYFADIGDFAKFGLLRALCDGGALKLGLIWYLIPDEGTNHNGQHVQYLEDRLARLRQCDPELFDRLAALVRQGRRSVGEAPQAGLLPGDTVFVEELLTFAPATAPVTVRAKQRERWLEIALAKTASCDIVNVDPDNGLENASPRKYSKNGTKFAYYDDLRPMTDRGQSIVIYQHFDRSGTGDEQAARRFAEIRERLNVDLVVALRFLRISPRFFFVVANERHEDLLSNRITAFMSSPWGQHFRLIS